MYKPLRVTSGDDFVDYCSLRRSFSEVNKAVAGVMVSVGVELDSGCEEAVSRPVGDNELGGVLLLRD